MDPVFRGSGTALITPFVGGAVDYAALERIVEQQIAAGTAALVVNGTTGEPPTLSTAERSAVAKFVIDRAAGRVPVIAGSGTNSTQTSIDTSLAMQDLGADGLLLVTPYYNKATQDGLVAHYSAVADAVETPLFLYNVPSRTGLNLEPTTVAALADHPRIVGVKEASGRLEQQLELVRLCRGKLAIYSGNDHDVFVMLALGAHGVVSVVSHLVPGHLARIVDLFDQGDLAGSRAVQEEIAPLISQVFAEVSPIPVKAALEMMGVAGAEVRLPLTPIGEENRANLRVELEKLDLV